MQIVVREANDADVQLIAELTRASWAGKVAATSSGHRETTERVAGDLRSGGGFILLIDGQPAGSVRWMPLDSEPSIWEIARMGIVPAWRGQHCSQQLLEAVIHHGLACQAEELRLAIRRDQPKLIDFYAAYGFELAEELEYTHANPAEPLPMMMRRSLRY
ncbi:GNAT family N-acetyltransferase [Janthinobacterium sp.]|uniref:GNAT family N-acetyltransferase n=1 Tax=Janthinobacterium sp. TaxID=1871054 RepID=UPI002625F8B6|nr:GNAT family N-acetyltransferase [Janthinobacterium sp.]